MEGVEAVLGLHHARRMKVLLEDVICRLSEVQEEKFDCDLMLEGFSCYLKYKTKEQAMGGGLGADHEIYEAWHKVTRCFIKCLNFWFQEFSGTSESHKHFSLLFQNIQIQTSSEVCCFIVYKFIAGLNYWIIGFRYSLPRPWQKPWVPSWETTWGGGAT